MTRNAAGKPAVWRIHRHLRRRPRRLDGGNVCTDPGCQPDLCR
jgi:hypothetical protein